MTAPLVKYLGSRLAKGKIDNTGANPYGNGFWSVTFDPAILAMSTNLFEVYHMTVQGPAGSSLQVYVDTTFYDATSSGDLNSWDPNQVLIMRGGQSLYFYWNSSSTPQPVVTIWCQLPGNLLS